MINEHVMEMLRAGEGLRVEFKKAKDKLPNNIFETVCAFLNATGGFIFLGVDDDGTIVGVNPQAVPQMKKDLASLAHNPTKINPACNLYPEECEIDGKTIIVCQVQESSEIHRCDGEVYLRSDDGDFVTRNTNVLSGVLTRKLGLFTEKRPMHGFTMADLRPELCRKAQNLMAVTFNNHPWANLSFEELLQYGGFYTVDRNTNERCLNLAAVLMFGTDEAIFRADPALLFDCLLRREDEIRYDDREMIRTNLIETYEQVMDFIAKYLPDPFYLEGDQRISLRGKIFREAVSNIISHREYMHGSPGRIMIYKDRVEFTNPCVQYYIDRITPANLEPFARNPTICNFMVQMGRFERLGSGVRNTWKYLPIYAKGALPIFEETKYGFKLTLPLNGTPHDAPHDTPHDTPHDAWSLLPLLKVLEGELSRPELMEKMGLKDRKYMRKRFLYPAMQKGFIEMTAPDKLKTKAQKYRLTELGKQVLAGLDKEV